MNQPEMFDGPDRHDVRRSMNAAERRYFDEHRPSSRAISTMRAQVRRSVNTIERAAFEILEALESATAARPPQPGPRSGRGNPSEKSDPTLNAFMAVASTVSRTCHRLGLPEEFAGVDEHHRDLPLGLLWVAHDILAGALAPWNGSHTVELANPRGATYHDRPDPFVVEYSDALPLVTDGLCGTPWTSPQLIVHVRNATRLALSLAGDIAGAWEDAASPRAGQTGMDTPDLDEAAEAIADLARSYDGIAGQLRHWTTTSHPRAGIAPPACSTDGCDRPPRDGRQSGPCDTCKKRDQRERARNAS